MTGPEITPLLLARLSQEDGLVIPECGICSGFARADVAVIGDELVGYEVKGATDTLLRLPRQVEGYSKVFDRAVVVASPNHVQGALGIVPPWWGMWQAEDSGEFTVLRASLPNPSPDPDALASLLWHHEALGLLERYGLAKGMKSKGRHKLWDKLADNLPLGDLRREVRLTMKARGDWRWHPAPRTA